MPSALTWPEGLRLALSIVVNVEEGAQTSLADGDPTAEPVDELGVTPRAGTPNHGNDSNYAYGINAGLPRVAAALDAAGVSATWTCAALALERAPEVAALIRDRGDEAASHGHRWVHQFRMTEDEERAFLRAAVASITATIGQRPVGHLSRYLVTDRTRRLLREEGFLYHMDDYSRDEPWWDDEHGIVVVPYAIDTNDMRMWTHPSITPDAWADYAIATFDRLLAESSRAPRMMSLGVHLRIIGRPGRIGAFERFLQHATAAGDVWITTRRAIAERVVAAREGVDGA